MLSEEEAAHALPPSAANHAMETTQCGDAFIFQPNATWEAAALSTNPPPAHFYFCLKKVNYRD